MDTNAIIPGTGADNDTSNAGDVNAADAAEAAEWDAALKDYAPQLADKLTTETTTQETTQDEQADTTTTTTTQAPSEDETTTTTTTLDPSETPEQKVQREQREAAAAIKPGDGTDDSDEEDAPDQSRRTARQQTREAQREVETVAAEVREKMFADAPTRLVDKEGDPIDTIELVMQHINPNTGEGFTETEAATWLLAAQQQFNKNLADQDKQIAEIAETLVDLKDQADSINFQYGALLKTMPDLQQQLWTEFSKTLVKDPDTDIITKAPVSMESFYEMALQPYVKLAESLEAQEEARLATEKAEAEAKKLRTRSDRADVFGREDTDTLDDEDKEWDAAHKAYFGAK